MNEIGKFLMTGALLLSGIVGLAMSLCSGVLIISVVSDAIRSLSAAGLLFLAVPLGFLALGAGILRKSYRSLQDLFKDQE